MPKLIQKVLDNAELEIPWNFRATKLSSLENKQGALKRVDTFAGLFDKSYTFDIQY